MKEARVSDSLGRGRRFIESSSRLMFSPLVSAGVSMVFETIHFSKKVPDVGSSVLYQGLYSGKLCKAAIDTRWMAQWTTTVDGSCTVNIRVPHRAVHHVVLRSGICLLC